MPHAFEAVGGRRKLLSIGSVLHFARNGDVIWGAGRNGKIPDERHSVSRLDVRMVRGPKTRDFLMGRAIEVPELYGDPGLLVPTVFADKVDGWQVGKGEISIVPNLNDPRPDAPAGRIVNPRGPIWSVLRRIAESEMVVSSSLHGLFLAEAFGVPARLLRSRAEPEFKYLDYAQGTGRDNIPAHDSVHAALEAPDHAPPIFDPMRMIGAFPTELFQHSADR